MNAHKYLHKKTCIGLHLCLQTYIFVSRWGVVTHLNTLAEMIGLFSLSYVLTLYGVCWHIKNIKPRAMLLLRDPRPGSLSLVSWTYRRYGHANSTPPTPPPRSAMRSQSLLLIPESRATRSLSIIDFVALLCNETS